MLLAAPAPISAPSFVGPNFDKDDPATPSFVGPTFGGSPIVQYAVGGFRAYKYTFVCRADI